MRIPALTLTEARVLYSAVRNQWAPRDGYDEFRNALAKLSIAGVCCRDCAEPGIYPHRLGGVVCDKHKPQETK